MEGCDSLQMAEDMFSAFASGGEAGGSSLAGSRLFQYMGGSSGAKATAPSPLESSALHAPEFVPASASATAPTASLASLSLSSHEPQDFAFTATSVNTPQPQTGLNGSHQPSPFPDPHHQQMLLNEGNMNYYYDYPSEMGEAGAGLGKSGAEATGPGQPTYGGPPAHLAHYRPRGAAHPSFFASDEVKALLVARTHEGLAELNPDLVDGSLPPSLEGYADLVPLEPLHKPQPSMERPGFFMSHPSTVYKAVREEDGLTYALRRIHNCRLLNTKCLGRVEMWKNLQHANVVGLRHVFQTKAFNDFSLVFVYDYHSGAETLKARHFSQSPKAQGETSPGRPGPPPSQGPGQGPQGQGPPGPPQQGHWKGMEEAGVWNYVVQLSSALRTIHSNGMAATTIDPSKILVSGKSKLLINCCGIMDVLTWEQAQMNLSSAVHNFQQDELIALGRMIVALCCGSLAAAARENIGASIAYITRHYSADMKNIVSFLLSPPQQRPKNINDIMPMIGARFYSQLETAQMRVDMLENELAKEVDNGRLFRLLAKLGALNERPEFQGDPQWSETGDRYLLKLFRDHLFHQQTGDGRPWLDLAHVVACLNKLDAGVSEKLALASHDAHNLLLVSYADLRRCFASAFAELTQAAALPQPLPVSLPSQPSAPHNGLSH